MNKKNGISKIDSNKLSSPFQHARPKTSAINMVGEALNLSQNEIEEKDAVSKLIEFDYNSKHDSTNEIIH